jgi:hypothetical protein
LVEKLMVMRPHQSVAVTVLGSSPNATAAIHRAARDAGFGVVVRKDGDGGKVHRVWMAGAIRDIPGAVAPRVRKTGGEWVPLRPGRPKPSGREVRISV